MHSLCAAAPVTQEHKLQDSHTAEVEAQVKALLPSYGSCHWAVSTAKKGYSGAPRATLSTALHRPVYVRAAGAPHRLDPPLQARPRRL